MSDQAHIAVVDDHGDIRDLVGAYLSRHGYRTSLAADAGTLRDLMDRDMPDLIVLDVMMPGESGLDLCREIRGLSAVPIIFLTALADDTDRIVGLELGADDYLVKPFNPRELLARIRAVLRRAAGGGDTSKPTPARLAFDRWTLDTGRRELERDDGLSVALSTAEFRLLKIFLDHPRQVLTRDQLLDLTVGRTAGPFDRSIDNQVSRLRRKIETAPKSPEIIQTYWGGGYCLAADVTPV